ncbi:MAG: AAA family ATPase [Candidatus Hadarchaeum sp.]|uniref:AAA family ATPase n=1 Tax=Candidatus Hadarchaeum sp. TaxID=2883567 RepID=UPI003D0BB671
MAPQIIGIVGLPGSGKTEVARILASMGAPSVRMGDIVWEELRRRGKKITEKNVGRLSNELRKKEGLGAVAKRCIPLIKKLSRGHQMVVVDGIRGMAEVKEFRKAFGKNFHLLGCWSSQRTRYLRTSCRRRDDDTADIRSFQQKDKRELSWGLGDALALADFIIVNEGSLEDLRKKVEEIFGKIVGGKSVET